AAAAATAAAEAAAAPREAAPTATATELDAELLEAGLHLREVGRGGTHAARERLRVGLRLRLQRRDDLRHDARLVLGEQRQPGRDLGDTGELRDVARDRLLKGELRARQEEVVDEVRAGLAELREIGDHRLVRLDQ